MYCRQDLGVALTLNPSPDGRGTLNLAPLLPSGEGVGG